MKWKPDCITYAFISTLGRRALFKGSSCYQVAHINSEGNSKWTIFSGGQTSDEFFFLLLSRNRATWNRHRIYVHQLCLEQLKRMLPLAVWENEQNNIFVIAVFMRLWKGYVCAAPFHKTYLQSKMDPTRDLFIMAESHPSVPLHRDAHSLSKGLSSLYCCCGYAQKKKKNLYCILSRNLEYRSRHKTTFHPQRPPASCQIST